ncbi:hypothetical protein Tco_0812557 [Tanacetum coccineum]
MVGVRGDGSGVNMVMLAAAVVGDLAGAAVGAAPEAREEEEGVDQKSPLCFFGSLEGRWKRGLFVFLLFSRWSSASIFATSFVMPGVGRGVASIAGAVSVIEGSDQSFSCFIGSAMVVTIVCATSSMMPLGGVPAENVC